MIKPNELRIGNLVYNIHNKQIVKIRQLRIEIVEVFHTNKLTGFLPFEDIEPIPLTEEILLKCGVDDEMLDPADRGEFRSIGSFVFVKNSYGIYHYLMTNTELKYVHELQNIYYAIYKKELKIEL